MMYGSLVTQLLRDYKDVGIVNTELFKIGYNMGLRMIDEFLARTNLPACGSFKETMTVVAEVAFKIFLGLNAEVRTSSTMAMDDEHVSIVFVGNPLQEFVELPPSCAGLHYSMIICGALTGALRAIHLVVDCELIADELKGDPYNEIRVSFKSVLREQFQDEDD